MHSICSTFPYFVCRGPHFKLMATARLSLDNVHDSIHTHDMQVENLGESRQI